MLILAGVGLSGCASGSTGTRALALAPQLAGSASQSSNALEALGGGIIAADIAPRLSNGERRRALEAEYKALENAPVGQTVSWSNDRGTTSGQVSAAQAYQVGSQNCRQYTHTVLVDGQSLTARGTACRNEEGNWTPLL